MLTPCVCIRNYLKVSLDQAIVFDISSIIMFSRYESYKLFLFHANGHFPLLSITSVFSIWNNIFFFSLYLRWGATFHAGVIGDATWLSFRQRHRDDPLLTLLISLREGNILFKQFVCKCVDSSDAKTDGPCNPVAVSLV